MTRKIDSSIQQANYSSGKWPQCDWVLPRLGDEGWLCCAYIKDHSGDHHTVYAIDFSEQGEWKKLAWRQVPE